MVEPTPWELLTVYVTPNADTKLQDTQSLIRRLEGNYVTSALDGSQQSAQYKSRVSILFPESPKCSTSICSGRSKTLPGSNFLMKIRKPPNATPNATAMTIKAPVPMKVRYSTTAHGGSVAVALGSFQVTCVS